MPLNWQSNLYQPGRKLRVGWYDDSDFMVAVPGVRRAVKVVAELLEKDGHTVIHFQPPHLAQLCQDFFRYVIGVCLIYFYSIRSTFLQNFFFGI